MQSLSPRNRLLPLTLTFCLVPACGDSDTSPTPLEYGPKRAELVGAWTSHDSYQAGNIVLGADGHYTRTHVPPSPIPDTGSWTLEGSVLHWVDSADTVALVDGTLFIDVAVRPSESGGDISGTWRSHHESRDVTYDLTWHIEGGRFHYSVQGKTFSDQGSGTLKKQGQRYHAALDAASAKTSTFYASDDDGVLTLQLVGPSALHIGLEYVDESDGTVSYPLDAWTRTQIP